MAASNDIVANKEAISAFEPSLWGDFFATYTSPLQQRSEEWMRERRDKLNGEVGRMFEAAKAMSMADTVKLVDTLERLGIDNHFIKEIDEALCRVHDEELDFGNSNDLHVVALRFRLLRQHGFWVSADVFDKFRDGTGSFNMNLSNDPRGLLSLYNAAHMAVPGEMVLDDAITFTRRHLEVAKSKLRSPMEEQVSRSLEIPLPRLMWQIEAVHYITEYEKEDEYDAMILELSRLNLNLLRSVHLKELKPSHCKWWRDLYDNVKLTYARDRIVECYFYSITVFHGEESSVARIILAKLYALLVLFACYL
ncbi:(S)-beta-bisabolene synthase-like [Panicum hallii]|uniref:(S)-beta-bisabolene synthase-like n=1 Tax=Panicum hallii TaxID=206008 RepID=UPI000DF4CBCB|nr:(S)-beta-bisabolene synthase-like [Panicum hallii]